VAEEKCISKTHHKAEQTTDIQTQRKQEKQRKLQKEGIALAPKCALS
jgi:hypothetical protein